MKELKSTHSI